MSYPYSVQIEDDTTDSVLTIESDEPITTEMVDEVLETLFGDLDDTDEDLR